MKARLSSAVCGLSVVTLLAVVAFGGTTPAPAQVGPAPENPAAKVEPVGVEPQEPVRDPLDDAARLVEEGRLKEAVVLLERILTMDPTNTRAWEMYFEIALRQAKQHQENGEYGEAVEVLVKAMHALSQWRSILVLGQGADQEAIAKLVSYQEAVQKALDGLCMTVVVKAEELYEAGKGEHWYSNDDEEKFIEALVLLDSHSQRIDLLSTEVRRRHATIWTKCHTELGGNDVETYKLRSALTNGRKPQERG